jgi:hypothetical protein
MDAVTMLRENFIKANKMQKLLKLNKKVMDEVEPLTEVFMSILFKQLQNDVSCSHGRRHHDTN